MLEPELPQQDRGRYEDWRVRDFLEYCPRGQHDAHQMIPRGIRGDSLRLTRASGKLDLEQRSLRLITV